MQKLHILHQAEIKEVEIYGSPNLFESASEWADMAGKIHIFPGLWIGFSRVEGRLELDDSRLTDNDDTEVPVLDREDCWISMNEVVRMKIENEVWTLLALIEDTALEQARTVWDSLWGQGIENYNNSKKKGNTK